jgi:hypothetical protein
MSYIEAFGYSGTKYSLEVYTIGTAFYAVPGIYEFVRQNPNGTWKPIYIGQTHDFRNRLYTNLKNHHQWDCVLKHGATHIAVLRYDGSDANRIEIETDLRDNYPTLCNEQGR